MKDNTKILGALVLGAAAGAVLGLLFAPSKGSDLRQQIKDNAEDLIDELAEKINEGKETISGLREKGMAKTDGSKNQTQDEFGSYRTKPVVNPKTNTSNSNLNS